MAVSSSATASGRQLYQGQPVTSIATPSAPTLASAANGGSTLTAATYYVRISWVYSTGISGTTQESNASTESSLAITAGNQLNITIPAFPSGVTAAKVYVGTATNTETYQGQFTTTAGGTYSISTPITTNGSVYSTSNTTALILYQAPPASTNVTAPSATAYIKEIVIGNTTATAATFTLYLVPSGGTASVTNAIYTSVSVSGNDTKIFSGLNTMMPAGATLQALQGTTSALTVVISGTEVQ